MSRTRWGRMSMVLTLAAGVVVVGGATAEARVTCFGEKPTITGTAKADVLRGTANHDVIVGLGGNDVIKGLGGQDLLCGFAGSDRVIGGGGHDFVSGDQGNDTLSGGVGDDLLLGLKGNDSINGGAGSDEASFILASGVTVDLAAGSATGEGIDTLATIELIWGSDGDDTLTGDDHENSFVPGPGDDVVDGGAGIDFVDYFSVDTPVTVDLIAGSATAEGSDTFAEIEGVYSGTGDDTLTGDTGPNILFGGAGDDTISGGEGDDLLWGEAGDDSLDGGVGTDALDGGAGTDACVNEEDDVGCES